MGVIKKAIFLLFILFLSASMAFGDSNEALKQRIEKLEQELSSLKAELAEKQKSSEMIENISKHIKLHGVVEVEGSYAKGYDDVEESDITLATAQLDVEANLNDFISGKITFLWEEDETEPVDIDEAYITIGNTEKFPLYLRAGKQYLPLGEFDTNMISDPLTLELAEINESAISIGAETNGFFIEGSIFNGDVDKDNKDDNNIDEFSIYGGYSGKLNEISFTAWAGYLNNIADSDTLQDAVPNKIDDYIGGLCANLAIDFQNISFYASYAGALDTFKANELSWKNSGAKPRAWNIEAGYTFPVMEHDTTVAVAYQGTDEALSLGMPEARYIGSVTFSLHDNLSLAIEYAYDKDYGKKDGGTDEDAHTITTQLHLEF